MNVMRTKIPTSPNWDGFQVLGSLFHNPSYLQSSVKLTAHLPVQHKRLHLPVESEKGTSMLN